MMITCQCLQLGTCRLCGLINVSVHGASHASVLCFSLLKAALWTEMKVSQNTVLHFLFQSVWMNI